MQNNRASLSRGVLFIHYLLSRMVDKISAGDGVNAAEELLVQFKAVAQVGEHVKFEACMDVMDLLYENEETSVLYSSPEALAASVVVIAYIITVPAQRWEFPVLPWGQNPHASSAWCPGSSCASF